MAAEAAEAARIAEAEDDEVEGDEAEGDEPAGDEDGDDEPVVRPAAPARRAPAAAAAAPRRAAPVAAAAPVLPDNLALVPVAAEPEPEPARGRAPARRAAPHADDGASVIARRSIPDYVKTFWSLMREHKPHRIRRVLAMALYKLEAQSDSSDSDSS